MKLTILSSFFGSKKSKLEQFLETQKHLKLFIENGIEFINIDKHVKNDEINDLLVILYDEKYQIAFHDNVHPTLTDPGAYFSYSTEKSIDKNFWSMTYGNHGWSGGIYHIRDYVLARQIISLVKKEELTQIQVSNVSFFSHYEVKSKEESNKKSAEIQEMHRKMTSIEIVNKIASRDSHQIWEAACEIIALGQDREAIKPLLGLINQIDNLTNGIDLGGAFTPNSRFITGAKKTLNFHKDSDECTCNLYGILEQMNPNKEVEKGYLKIHNITRIEDKWVEYYEASCTRCNQQFKIEEGESHYMWWEWKRV